MSHLEMSLLGGSTLRSMARRLAALIRTRPVRFWSISRWKHLVRTRERLWPGCCGWRWRRTAVEVFSRLSTYYETRAKYEPTLSLVGSGSSSEQAIQYGYRQLELEPWREEAHRQVMRLLALSGQRSAALAQYESCRRALLEELGVEPEPETTGLYERILRGSETGTAACSEPRRHNLPAQVTPFIGREE